MDWSFQLAAGAGRSGQQAYLTISSRYSYLFRDLSSASLSSGMSNRSSVGTCLQWQFAHDILSFLPSP